MAKKKMSTETALTSILKMEVKLFYGLEIQINKTAVGLLRPKWVSPQKCDDLEGRRMLGHDLKNVHLGSSLKFNRYIIELKSKIYPYNRRILWHYPPFQLPLLCYPIPAEGREARSPEYLEDNIEKPSSPSILRSDNEKTTL